MFRLYHAALFLLAATAAVAEDTTAIHEVPAVSVETTADYAADIQRFVAHAHTALVFPESVQGLTAAEVLWFEDTWKAILQALQNDDYEIRNALVDRILKTQQVHRSRGLLTAYEWYLQSETSAFDIDMHFDYICELCDNDDYYRVDQTPDTPVSNGCTLCGDDDDVASGYTKTPPTPSPVPAPTPAPVAAPTTRFSAWTGRKRTRSRDGGLRALQQVEEEPVEAVAHRGLIVGQSFGELLCDALRNGPHAVFAGLEGCVVDFA